MRETVLTVTLNPALDKTVNLETFRIGELNRVAEVRSDPGGKGINVAKVLQRFGEPVIATGLAGGYAGRQLIGYLDELGIHKDFILVQGETRTNLKIVDMEQKITTEIKERGAEASHDEGKQFLERMDSLLDECRVLVLGGSILPGLPTDIYRTLTQLASRKGVKTILDADGEALVQGLEGQPFGIKPNIHELEQLIGAKLESDSSIVEAANKLVNKGIHWVVVSMGGDGSIFVSREQIVRARPFPIVPQSTVGAGDSMVAAMAACLLNGRSLEETARWATAAGSLTAAKPGTEVCGLQEVEEHLEQVVIEVSPNHLIEKGEVLS